MPLPLKITMFDPGLGGAPTQTNPRDLSGWATELSDSQCNEFGSESLTLTGYVDSIEAAIDFTQRLMSAVEVYTPTGRARFFGFLHGVTVPVLHCSVSMEDLANVVILRYTTPNNVKGTATASNAASIARYGRKEIVLNYSDVLAAEATNRAAMILGLVQEPPNTEPVSVDKGEEPPFRVDLTFRGWAEALKWVTTSNTTQATAVTSTQVTSLITAYNAINNFFDTAGAQVTSTAFSATQYCPPDTTYYDRIQTLLSAADSSQRRVAWGFYTRAITIGTAAAATPDTIAYSYSRRKAELRDGFGNIIPPWDWAPDCMIQNVDAIVPPAPTGALATLTRKYIRRVTLRIGSDGIPHGNMEPDDVKNLPSFLAKPVSTDTGASSRHAQIEARIAKAVRSRTFNTDGPSFNPVTGVVNPIAGGSGISNVGTMTVPSNGTIDLGGGSIGNTGGGNVDLGTGAGIGGGGSSGVSTAGGTVGAIAKWTSATALGNAISGTDYAPAHAHPYAATSHTHTTGDVTGGIDGSGANGRVAFWTDANTLTSSSSLLWDGTNFTVVGPIITDGSSSGIFLNERDGAGQWAIYSTASLLRIYDGAADVVTIDGNGQIASDADTIILGAFTLNLDGSLRVSGAGAATGEALIYNGTAFIPTAIDAAPSDAKYIVQTAHAGLSAEQALSSLATGVMKVTTTTGVVSSMTGTSGRITEWEDGTTIGPSTLIKTGAGVTTIDSASTITLDLDGSSGNVLRHNGTNWIAAALATTDLSNFNEAVDDRVDALLVAGTNITLTYNDASNTLTVASTASGTVGGTGTAGRLMQWASGGADAENSTLVKSGAGVLTLSAGSAFTFTVPATGTAVVGTGGTNRIAFWTGANTLGSNSPFSYDQSNGAFNIDGSGTWGGGLNVGTASGAGTGDVRGSGVGKFTALATVSDNRWELGGYTATVVTDTGYLSVEVDNVVYQMLVKRP